MISGVNSFMFYDGKITLKQKVTFHKMKPVIEHPWDLDEESAKKLQIELAKKVKETPLEFEPRYVAGVDISYNVGSDLLFGGVVVLDVQNFSIVDKVVVHKEVKFPYIPGLLSFRETPVLIEAFQKLKVEPDMIFVDGQGLAHPRFFGIASHIGVLYDKPAIGVAKKILVGKPLGWPKKEGEWVPLVFRGRTVGAVLLTQVRQKPIIVSVGHKITLEEAVSWVKKLTGGFRLPEPTRLAHIITNEARRKSSA